MKRRVAIIGGGIAGLACAATLGPRAQAIVFDKGRSPGGRLLTRRMPPHAFDLGAQYFTAEDDRFTREVRAWIDEGVCARWDARVGATEGRGGPVEATRPVDRFVGVTTMTAIARHLARDVEVRASHRVDRLERRGKSIVVHGTIGAPGETLRPRASDAADPLELGSFDAVAVCLPPDQAAPLLDGVSPSLAAAAREVSFLPCLALGFTAGDDSPLAALPFDGVFVGRDEAPRVSAISWAARDSSKPGRPPGQRWVVHADGAWSRERFDEQPEIIEPLLLEALSRALSIDVPQPLVSTLQRWRYAKSVRPLKAAPLVDTSARIAVGGDWTSSGAVEGAYLSGLALADVLRGDSTR